jgi:hypothetical protein
MLAINPLLPFFPDSISFLIYGLVTGLLLKFWRIAKKNIFLIIFFLYVYAVWAIIMFAFITVQPEERQAWFIFGFALTFVKILSIIRTIAFTPFTWAYETITEGIGERRADRRDQQRREQREQESRNYHDRDQDIRAEQARREAEARANRARGAGNEQTKTDNDRVEDRRKQQQNRPPAPPPTEERRSYEQILGLTDGWTDEDLKKAYQREANRTHPDKWIGKPQAMRDMMEAEYKAVQEAYRQLKK